MARLRILVTQIFIAGLLSLASPLHAGQIERACNASDRSAASPRLCDCIQQVADARLKKRDQRMAASFFKTPHKAQEIRQSDSRSHEEFWQRYKAFTATAEASCRATG